MPIKQGNKLVELREEVVKGLERAYQLGLRSAPDFTSFVNNLLLDVIRREEFLATFFGHYLSHSSRIMIVISNEIMSRPDFDLIDFHFYIIQNHQSQASS